MSYWQLYKESVRDILKNPTIFWSAILLTAIYYGVVSVAQIPIIVQEAANPAVSVQNSALHIWLGLIIDIIGVLYSIFYGAALYGSFSRTIKKKNVGINEFFGFGKKHFWGYLKVSAYSLVFTLPAVIVFGLISLLLILLKVTGPVFIFLLVIMGLLMLVYIFFISYKLLYAVPHLIMGHTAKQSVLYSWKNSSKNNEQLRVFWSYIGISILVGLASGILFLLSIPLVLVLIGIPLMIGIGLAYYLLIMSLALFIMKCYSKSLKRTK